MITLPENDRREDHEIKQKSPVELAFIGDAVYELLVREYISLRHDVPAGKLHAMCVQFVRAEAQQHALETLQSELTEEETDLVRRGRNANKVMTPKHSDPAAYRAATGLETLFGYLYLTGKEDRIRTLFARIADASEAAGGETV